MKIGLICELLGCSKYEAAVRSNPFKVVKGCAPGSVRKHVSFTAWSLMVNRLKKSINGRSEL